jgi:hypothetical protein
MILNPEYHEWLEHRAGLMRSEMVGAARLQQSLRTLTLQDSDSYGRREIQGFAGLVRLGALADRTAGWRAGRLRDYLAPFQTEALNAIHAGAALTETFGAGEIGFIWPDRYEDNGHRADRLVGLLLRDLSDLQQYLGPDYPMEVSVCYGSLYVDRLRGDGYDTWSIVGEPVVQCRDLLPSTGRDHTPLFHGAFARLPGDSGLSFETMLMALAGNWLEARRYAPGSSPLGDGPEVALLLPRS